MLKKWLKCLTLHCDVLKTRKKYICIVMRVLKKSIEKCTRVKRMYWVGLKGGWEVLNHKNHFEIIVLVIPNREG